MKTNFLYFREHGSISFTATATQTDFAVKGSASLVPGSFGGGGFSVAIADTTALRANYVVTITSLADNTGNRGGDYQTDGVADANTTAGQVTTLEVEALSISSNNMVIANVSGDSDHGYDIKVGDIVAITANAAKGNVGAYRADRLLSVHSNSNTATEATFQAADGSAADDTIVFTHGDDNGVTFRAIANYLAAAADGNFVNSGSCIIAFDAESDDIPKQLKGLGITNMLLGSA
tara:strand:+ start:57 stop:758 length:702 start_codon:yes stop_codon:yes gene_type:complete